MCCDAEAVIISCGAPDSFDVYEVPDSFSSTCQMEEPKCLVASLEACFETLTKLGFAMPGIANKETSISPFHTASLAAFLAGASVATS